jgi:hypothetical protein
MDTKTRRVPVYAAAGALVIGAGVAVAATRPDGRRAVDAGNAASTTAATG